MKYLPTGRQNFKDIIQNNLLYVDKTQQMYELIRNGSLYFLSRPRRFGKSLLLSKFQYLFGGEKDLFKGLYIHEKTDYDFEKYPVLHFSFASFGHKLENFEEVLHRKILSYAEQFNITINKTTLSEDFTTLVQKISEKDKPVVLLIDEYDTPITDFLTEIKKAKKNQSVLKDFFAPLKNLDAQGHLRFLFITGVSKFSKVSLFSDLNNLKDITISRFSDDLVGITHEELLANFSEHIDATAQYLQYPKEELLSDIKHWYNGYAYNPDIPLYNPFSLLNFFSERRFGNFWFATGTPTFLVNTIRDRGIKPMDFVNKEVSETFFTKFSLADLDMTGLLFQTGYLTIKAIQRKRTKLRYFLDYPNEEVRQAMMHNLVEAFTYKRSSLVSNALSKMERGLDGGKVEMFIDQLKILLSDLTYHHSPKKKKDKQNEFEVWEGYFHTIIYLITTFMGMYVHSEIAKHKGRLDLLIEVDDFLYLMEFKLDEPAKNAIQQIKDREYAAAYKNSLKTIYLVGIGFSKKERNVESWEAEIWER